MGLNRNVDLLTGLRYKGQGPYLTFILHRVGGSALFIFFTLYILTLAGVEFAHVLFSNPFLQIAILVFGLFHAINGVRITIFDLFPKLIGHYRIAINVEWAIYALFCGFAIIVVLRNAAGG